MDSIFLISLVLIISILTITEGQFRPDGPRDPYAFDGAEDTRGGPGRSNDFGGPDGQRGPGGQNGFGGPDGHRGSGGQNGFGGPDGRRGPGGPGGHRGPGGPPNMLQLFSACAEMGQALRQKHTEMMKNGEIGYRNCQGGDISTCRQKDMKTVRCAVEEKPSQKCMDQIMAFMTGDICNDGSIVTPTYETV
ncbi:uncharacterized protein CDAR_67381 [Caerostris darwini]|uniref:Uncharacterized protein n=1 Tax=Caerostris darwini TaxID=1538125 RepID=A0AAV4U8A1_9ARAC|nr:uncharacterized protein CDAR_67381 [Caerostris darwini]